MRVVWRCGRLLGWGFAQRGTNLHELILKATIVPNPDFQDEEDDQKIAHLENLPLHTPRDSLKMHEMNEIHLRETDFFTRVAPRDWDIPSDLMKIIMKFRGPNDPEPEIATPPVLDESDFGGYSQPRIFVV